MFFKSANVDLALALSILKDVLNDSKGDVAYRLLELPTMLQRIPMRDVALALRFLEQSKEF